MGQQAKLKASRRTLAVGQAERVRDALDAFITEQKEQVQAEGLAAADIGATP